jgi:hypothetical protein
VGRHTPLYYEARRISTILWGDGRFFSLEDAMRFGKNRDMTS